MQRDFRKKLMALAMLAALGGASGVASAAGFALIEQNASGLGNAYAGGAAIAEDASTIFFNPAGLSRISGKQLSVSGEAIGLSVKFQNQGSNSLIPGIPLMGGNGGDAGGWAVVPNLYFATDIAPQWKFGLGINAPFGLKTDYDAGWVGRYQALETKVETININPSVAYKVNDQVSVGGGVSAMYIKGDLSKAIDFGSIGAALGVPGSVPQNQDGAVKFDGSGWGYGYNFGALFQVTPDTRVGVAYRSKIKEDLTGGQASFSGVPAAFAGAPQFSTTGARASITLPETASLSAFTQIDSKWAIMGDVTWTKWSRFNELRLQFDNGAPDSVTTENWKDTYRVSAGVSYQYSDSWKLRGGIAYDKSPVEDQYRTARIPDNDRKWVALGASYKVSGAGVVDFGYAHLFISDASINHTESSSTGAPVGGTLTGNYSGSVDILGIQYTHNF